MLYLGVLLFSSVLFTNSIRAEVVTCSSFSHNHDKQIELSQVTGEWVAVETYHPFLLGTYTPYMCVPATITLSRDDHVTWVHEVRSHLSNNTQRYQFVIGVKERENGHWLIKNEVGDILGETLVLTGNSSRYLLLADCEVKMCGSEREMCLTTLSLWRRTSHLLDETDVIDIRNKLRNSIPSSTLNVFQFNNLCVELGNYTPMSSNENMPFT